MVKLMAANMEVESTGSRTTRGMVGQLERGYQIAQPPYGYRASPEVTETGKVLGTKWFIHEPEAQVVRRIYALRHQGLSCPTIAATLQREGVVPPGNARAALNAMGLRPPFNLVSFPVMTGAVRFGVIQAVNVAPFVFCEFPEAFAQGNCGTAVFQAFRGEFAPFSAKGLL